jgi:hypothetical protein
MSSSAKVLVVDVRHGTRVKAIGVDSAKTANATTAETAHVTSTKATHVASAKAAHTATTVSSAAATATSGLCARGKQAPGQYCGCQYRYHSSFHDFLHLDGQIFRLRSLSDLGVSQQSETPKSRYTGDENPWPSSPLKSLCWLAELSSRVRQEHEANTRSRARLAGGIMHKRPEPRDALICTVAAAKTL